MPYEGLQDSRPRLVVPYWPPAPGDPGDTGDLRPVPTTVPWYLCGGIRTSTYLPGAPLEVTVDVRNLGGSTAPALAEVTVWWTDPTLGFVIVPSNLVGYRQVTVPPRGGAASTAVMTKLMPVDAPPHICLLARVSHRDDPAPAVPDPVGDRHWAQRNLAVVTAPPGGGTVALPVLAANPFDEAAEFRVHLGVPEHAGLLAGADGVDGRRAVDLRPLVVLDGVRGDGAVDVDVALGPGEVRRLEAEVHVEGLDERAFVAREIAQRHGRRRLGGLGLVVVGA